MRLLSASLLVLSACDGQASQFFDGGHNARKASEQDGLQRTGWVTDAANILTASDEERIAQQLRQLERQRGHQMVVVTVPTLEEQPIEEYTIDLARRWGVGRREHNDGLVVLVAPNERKVRIEVGTGLEQVVTNSFAAAVIQTVMIPRFRADDYAGGLRAGVETLIGRLATQ